MEVLEILSVGILILFGGLIALCIGGTILIIGVYAAGFSIWGLEAASVAWVVSIRRNAPEALLLPFRKIADYYLGALAAFWAHSQHSSGSNNVLAS